MLKLFLLNKRYSILDMILFQILVVFLVTSSIPVIFKILAGVVASIILNKLSQRIYKAYIDSIINKINLQNDIDLDSVNFYYLDDIDDGDDGDSLN